MNKTTKFALTTVTLLTAFTLATSITSPVSVSANEPQTNLPTDVPGVVTYTTKPTYVVAATIKLDSTKPDSSQYAKYKTIEDVEYEDSETAPAGYVKDESKTNYYENMVDYKGSIAYKFYKPVTSEPEAPTQPEAPAQPEAPTQPEAPNTTLKEETSNETILPKAGDSSILSLLAGLTGLGMFSFRSRKNK